MTIAGNAVVAMTGATGFLGSHLMAGFLKRGHRVLVLGRSTEYETLHERLAILLDWFGLPWSIDLLDSAEIDFFRPRLGLSQARYNLLCHKTNLLIHCASDTSFAERKREQVLAANVHGLDNILKFASDSHASFFHYISTVYAAGLGGLICEERPVEAPEFVNVYEESKAMAEKIITGYCNKNSVAFSILRPPIVYGDSRTGRSLKFNALYYPVNSLQHIRDIYLNDIKIRGGIKAKESGIFLDRDGLLNMPLRIYLPHPGSLNLIPIDYFVKAVLLIMKNPVNGMIYHLTNNTATRIEPVAEYIERFLKIKGIKIIYVGSGPGVMRNPAEELFDHFIKPYRPYLSDQRVFTRKNTDLATDNLAPPEFDYNIFARCMEYAQNVNWGKELFSEHELNSYIMNAAYGN
jgi:nucleoside-diphosphate-sugar epimerase